MRHELRTERELSLDFLRVCEAAAISSARTMGQGDRKYSDHVAVEAMREVMDTVPMRGRIVIGEGERDEAPMLYIGEKVGLATHAPKALFPQVDIAVDPLEGTNLCATGAANSIADSKHADQPAAKSCSGLVPVPGVPGRDSLTSRRPSELRDIYSASRFVVIPLHDRDQPSGQSAQQHRRRGAPPLRAAHRRPRRRLPRRPQSL